MELGKRRPRDREGEGDCGVPGLRVSCSCLTNYGGKQDSGVMGVLLGTRASTVGQGSSGIYLSMKDMVCSCNIHHCHQSRLLSKHWKHSIPGRD